MFRRLSLLSVCVLLLTSFAARGAEAASAARAVFLKTLPATVLINNETEHSMGSGWVIDADRRLVITNHHVVGDANRVEVVFPEVHDGLPVQEMAYYYDLLEDHPIRARVIDSDPKRDLALIQLDSLPEGTTALKLASGPTISGDSLYSIGSPDYTDACFVLSAGEVRAVVKRKIRYSDQLVDCRIVESTSPTNPGDSGGPVVNEDGELVAVVTGCAGPTLQKNEINDPRLVTFMIDVTEVRSFLSDTLPMVDAPKSPKEKGPSNGRNSPWKE